MLKLKKYCTIFLQMLSRLDLNGLLCVNMIPGDEKIGIVLKFSHVHKERKYREYLFDDEGQCEVCSGLKFFNVKSITYIYSTVQKL